MVKAQKTSKPVRTPTHSMSSKIRGKFHQSPPQLKRSEQVKSYYVDQGMVGLTPKQLQDMVDELLVVVDQKWNNGVLLKSEEDAPRVFMRLESCYCHSGCEVDNFGNNYMYVQFDDDDADAACKAMVNLGATVFEDEDFNIPIKMSKKEHWGARVKVPKSLVADCEQGMISNLHVKLMPYNFETNDGQIKKGFSLSKLN